MIKFYKESATGNWVCGVKRKIATGTCTMETNADSTYIEIKENGIDRTIAEGPVTSFVNEAGTAYANFSELESATTDFFVNAAQVAADELPFKADLVNGKVPAEQLPSYVDDVVNIEWFREDEPIGAIEDQVWYVPTGDGSGEYYVKTSDGWDVATLDYGKIYINNDNLSSTYNSTYRYNGIELILLGANITREYLEGILATRTGIMISSSVDMNLYEDFVKNPCSTNQQFTISNPIQKKIFRIFMTGGTLNPTPFNGYTATWILNALSIDYTGTAMVLVCEIRAANTIHLFWSE